MSEASEELFEAVSGGDLAAVKRLVAGGADVRARAFEWTLLAVAVACGHGAVAEYLIERGATGEDLAPDDQRALPWALSRASGGALVRGLLERDTLWAHFEGPPSSALLLELLRVAPGSGDADIIVALVLAMERVAGELDQKPDVDLRAFAVAHAAAADPRLRKSVASKLEFTAKLDGAALEAALDGAIRHGRMEALRSLLGETAAAKEAQDPRWADLATASGHAALAEYLTGHAAPPVQVQVQARTAEPPHRAAEKAAAGGVAAPQQKIAAKQQDDERPAPKQTSWMPFIIGGVVVLAVLALLLLVLRSG